MSPKRDYGQFCGLASALNVIGERWTLLVVRELLIGPAQFTELLDTLSGIGPNLLTERLRTLVDLGVVAQRQVRGDGRARQYVITGVGEELRQPVLWLTRWGVRFIDGEDGEDGEDVRWQCRGTGQPSPEPGPDGEVGSGRRG
ncbi:winged helix-turn-helix transcriptional regulator [Saccharomonospora iraqiensis]|uniref:winged helix-turn-helix transcriptional regulator n=1 Tax=Saccharomonospora iraqiensis TaxID=52698 RepID=UPI0002F63C58|nr:helix-turn-helix domain-containing protein [Saccharomonospora iraqiensis]